jgi:transposase
MKRLSPERCRSALVYCIRFAAVLTLLATPALGQGALPNSGRTPGRSTQRHWLRRPPSDHPYRSRNAWTHSLEESRAQRSKAVRLDRSIASKIAESSSVEHVSREVGVSVATLERWRADALANGSASGNQRWTATARLQAVIATAAMDEATRSAWCREQGVYPAELDAWKQDAIAGLGEPRASSAVEARQDRRRVKELERELRRKDKALAETAALLVLSKKIAAVFHEGEDV